MVAMRGLEEFEVYFEHFDQHYDSEGVDMSEEAVAFRQFVKKTVCMPKGQGQELCEKMKLQDIVHCVGCEKISLVGEGKGEGEEEEEDDDDDAKQEDDDECH